MKRWIASVLTACFLMPGAAMADGVLSDGWQEASTDALLNARTQISNQLRKSTISNPSAEAVSFSGEGMKILDSFTLDAGVWCRWVTLDKNDYFYKTQIIESSNGKTDKVYLYRSEVELLQFSEAHTFDYVSVEIEPGWTIEYRPLDYNGTLELSGDSCAVSCFTCDKPTVVTVTAARHNMETGYYGINLYSINSRGKLSHVDYTASDNLEEGEEITKQAIISPSDDVVCYIWEVVCDKGVAWSITAK